MGAYLVKVPLESLTIPAAIASKVGTANKGRDRPKHNPLAADKPTRNAVYDPGPVPTAIASNAVKELPDSVGKGSRSNYRMHYPAGLRQRDRTYICTRLNQKDLRHVVYNYFGGVRPNRLK